MVGLDVEGKWGVCCPLIERRSKQGQARAMSSTNSLSRMNPTGDDKFTWRRLGNPNRGCITLEGMVYGEVFADSVSKSSVSSTVMDVNVLWLVKQ